MRHQTPVPTTKAYAPRSKKAGKRKMVGIRLSAKTVAGVEHLQELFESKYPRDRCPTLSALMADMIQARVLLFDCRPSLLDAEIKDFRNRYATKVSHDGR